MKKLNFFKKIELIITHPHRFFNRIEKNKSVKEVFEFYFIFVFLSMLINLIFRLPEFTKSQLNLSFLSYVLFIIVSIVFFILLILLVAVSSFVLYWLYHILIKFFRGKKRYTETYKLLYAATPLLIVSLIPYYSMFKLIFFPLFIIAALDTFYIEYVGLQKLQKMSKENAFVVVVLSMIIGILSIYYLIQGGLIVL